MLKNALLTVLTLGLVVGFAVTGYSSSCGSSKAHNHLNEAGEHVKSAVEGMDIVETAVKAGSFNTLVTAVKAAGLVETLQGEGPFTVFAPTDEAFAKLPEAAITALLKDKKQLTSVLTYHVVPGLVTAEDVVKLTSARTVNGRDLAIMVSDGNVMVNGSKVTATDIVCSNGVIHIIDTVILPENN